MSQSSVVSLGAVRLQAMQRADLENSTHITTPEWNQYISNSYKELYDLLVSAYGNEYYVQTPYQLTTTSAQFYDLPSDFYKLLGVDLQYSASPSGYVTMKKFEFIERNRYAYPNTQVNWNGYTNLRYRLMGNQVELVPIPQAGQIAQVWYIPKPTSLQFIPSCVTTNASATITLDSVDNIVAGMSVYAAGGVPFGLTSVTVSSVNTGAKTAVLSTTASSTNAVVPMYFWIDSATLDGISGWEEYIIIDAAIKAGIKEETDVESLQRQKMEMRARIESMAEGRDAGQPSHVSDVMGINGFGYDDFGGGFGMGGGM